MKKVGIVVVVLMILVFSQTVHSQPKTPMPSDTIRQNLQDEIARLRAELAACQDAKKVVANSARSEAVASLRAVRSALSTGANLEEFKKYQIESRIKVDALPDMPENRPIREISNLYKDAVTFALIRITGTISSSDLEAARAKYASIDPLKQVLSEMYDDPHATRFMKTQNSASAQAVYQMLFVLAEQKFSELK